MIYDISPLIDESLAVFPGDTPFQRKTLLSFTKGDHLELSSLQSTLHIGAHLDAPIHYHPSGESIDQCSLELYMGPCEVVDLSDQKLNLKKEGEIGPEDLGEWVPHCERVLFKTNTFNPHGAWPATFAHLSPETIAFLGQRGVRLVGIDTPSMDHPESKSLLAHKEVYKQKMNILEGLNLVAVPQGRYGLIALPLKIKGGEASPVRALLMTQEQCHKTFQF